MLRLVVLVAEEDVGDIKQKGKLNLNLHKIVRFSRIPVFISYRFTIGHPEKSEQKIYD